MSTHAREYWLNVQAREAVRIAMDIEVDQCDIDGAVDEPGSTLWPVVGRAAVGLALSKAQWDAAYQLALAEQLHRLWVGMEDV